MTFFKATGLFNQEWATHVELEHAIAHARNRRSFRHRDRMLFRGQGALELAAVNWRSRERIGRALCNVMAERMQLKPPYWHPATPVWFFTLVDKDCGTDDDAKVSGDDIKRFKRLLRPGIQGLHYIAMLEPAIYVNVKNSGPNGKKSFVSWHLHGVCWGVTANEIRRRFRSMNNDDVSYRPILSGLEGARCRVVPNGQFADKLRYILKAPRKEYRVYEWKWPTGSQLKSGFGHRKQDLRPGNRLKLFHLLKHLYLDELALAGGDGVAILKSAKQVALKKYNRIEKEALFRRRKVERSRPRRMA